MDPLGYEYKNASFFKRFTAFYLALFFILIGTAAIGFILVKFNLWGIEFNTYRFWLIILLVFLVLVVTDAFFQSLLGANLAKRLLGLKIVDKNTLRPLGLFQALIRTIAGIFSFVLFGLGFIAIAFNKDALSMHDLLSGSKVIEKQRVPVLKIITNLFAAISFLIGSLILLAFISSLLIAPLSLGKTFYSLAQYSKYDIEDFKSANNFNIKINNNKVFAFIYGKTPDYVDFELDPSAERSTITKSAAEKLGLGFMDYYLTLKNNNTGLSKFSLNATYLADHLSFKDLNSKDLDLFNFNFILADKSVLGYDLLSVFDFNIDEQKNLLILKPFRGDGLVMKNPEYDLDAKQYLLYMLRKIRKSWDEYLKQSSPETLESLSTLNRELRNVISLSIDTETGFVMKATLLKPTKVKVFDTLTESFLSDIERLRMMPDSLKKLQVINLELDLVYQEMI